MLVKELGSYSLLLNKFPVFPNHLLLITTQFQPQTDHLNLNDFSMLLQLLEELKLDEKSPEWLTFYNRFVC
jgi:ATP adenylyltransferase